MAGSEPSPDWRVPVERAPAARLTGTVWRMVESQEQIATRPLVDTLEEQDLLETLVERAKPSRPPGAERLHYLLATPFRYPPLPWGSRFGPRTEPSLFYGARQPPTMLAEVAYYRFVFWYGMERPPARPYVTQHTAFAARIACAPALRLQAPPFDDHRRTLTDPRDYGATQALGGAMRAAAIAGFEFPSARCPRGGLNVGLFAPAAIADRRPRRQHAWVCETTAERVTFRAANEAGVTGFTPATVRATHLRGD